MTDAQPRAAARFASPEQRARIDVMQLFLAQWRVILATLALITVTVMLAWRDYAPLHVRATWCGAAFLDYVCQGAVCYRMQHSASPAEAMTRWMPLLLVTIAASSTLWALVPWLIPGASTQVLLFACLFNALMFYCLASTPGAPSMYLSAALPIVLLDTLVLARHEGLGYVAAGFPIMIGLILLYGLRHEAVLRAGGTVLSHGEFCPGEPYAFVTDPDGYQLELWYEP